LHSQRKPGIAQRLFQVAALLCTAASLFFWFFYFTLYWSYRDLFNEEGRYFDESSLVVYHEQNGMLIVPALALSLLAMLFGFVGWMRRLGIGHSLTDND
jgi:hypothetical protein